MNASDVDAALQEWGNRVFNSGPVRKRIRRGMTGVSLTAPRSESDQASPRPMDASEVRRKMGSLVKRSPQVMVRISGGGKGIRHIKAHLDYISRNGQVPLEDQNGDKLVGKEDIMALRDEWELGGFAIDVNATSRQAFNIILSMPAGTSDVAVSRAVRDFASAEFHNFQYVMAVHTPETDPDADPSPNPHVHLCVKATSLDGTRLNPRKADLHRWREEFARSLREHGVECEATRRLHRLQPKRGEKQSVLHKRERGESLDRIGTGKVGRQRAEKARQKESQVLSGYRALALALANSPQADDRQLALDVVWRLAQSQRGLPRGPDVPHDR